MRTWFAKVALGTALVLSGCSKKPDVIVKTADDAQMTEAQIDGDPIALLPGNAIGVGHVDTAAFFKSAFGQRMKALANARIPLPPSAGFDPERDLTEVYVGVYSMQGADTLAVAKGRFDPAAIARAADGTTNTPLGAPLVKTTYSKRTIYVSRNVGFVVLSAHTVLLGNETGIRRALDRLSEGRVTHATPKWVDKVLETPNAAMAVAVDLVGKPVAEGVSKSMPFLAGLRTARIVGNFEPPGMNFAGTLTYPDADAARAGATGIQGLRQRIQQYSFFMTLAGIGNPIERLEVAPSGSDAQFVLALEARAVEWLLGMLADRFAAGG